MTMERNRREQIDTESSEVKDDIKSEDETSESSDSDEDEIPVDLELFSEKESKDGNCQHEQDPLQPGTSSISPGVSRKTNSRQNLEKGTGVTFKNKLEFTVEMQKEVSLIVEECTQVLKTDPREYHPLYLTVHKWIEIGLKQGHISEKKMNLIWEKCDAFAVAQFKKDHDNPSSVKNDKPQTEYLQCILTQKEIKPLNVSRSVRTVEREWKRDIADEDPSHHKHLRTNLHARLKFFQSAKSIKSPEDCVHMNSLWNRLLSSKQAPTCSRTQHENPSLKPNKNVHKAESKDKGARRNEQKRLKLQQETEKEKEERRKKVNEQIRLRRSRESEEVRLKRRAKQAHFTKLRRERLSKQMTPEEMRALKDKEAKMARLRRAKLLEKMSPEEREARKDKQMDRPRRGKRLGKDNLQKATFVETEKEKENLRQIRELRKRLKLDAVSLEEKVQIRMKIRELSKPRLERVKALRKAFMEGLSEEDRFQYKMNSYLEGQARRARSGKRKSGSSLPPDLREYERQRQKKYYQSLPSEIKQRYEDMKKRKKKDYLNLKQDPVKFAEVNKKQNEWYKRRNVTVEQARKRQKRINDWQRRKTEKETEEQRWKRLIRYKVYQARIRLRKEMEEEEEEDFTEDEFEKRLENIVKQIKAQPIPPSKYKPRPRKASKTLEVPVGSVDKVGDEEERDLPAVTIEPVLEMELHLEMTGEKELPAESCSLEPVFSLEVNDASQFANCGTSLFECETLAIPEPEHEVVDCSWSPESSRHSPIPNEVENEMVPVTTLTQSESIFQSDVSVEVERASEEVTLNGKLVGERDEGKRDESLLETLVECAHCLEQFHLDEDLRAHVYSKHRGKCWTCPICKKVILSPTELVEHFQIEHNEEGEALPGNEVKEPKRLIQGNSKVRKRSGRRKRV